MTQYIVFLILAPIAVMVSLATLVVASVYRKRIGFASLRVYLLSQLVFLCGNCLLLLDRSESGVLFWAKAYYLFTAVEPVLWFLFAMEYAGFRGWLKPLPVIALFAFPAATSVFAAWNEVFHLIWRQYSFERVGAFLIMRVSEYGPWFGLYIAYCYVLIILGGFAIFFRFFQFHSFYRRQASLILLGAILPFVFNIVFVFRLVPGLTKDYSPVFFAFGGVCFVIGILRFRLTNALPVSRSELVEGMSEGVLVVDGANRLVDINPAAARFFGVEAQGVIGTDIARILPDWESECRLGEEEGARRCLTRFLGPNGQGSIELSMSSVSRERGSAFQAVFRAESVAMSAGEESEEKGDPNPYLSLDPKGKILASGMLAEILGYSEAELRTKYLRDIVIDSRPFDDAAIGDTIDICFVKRTGETILSLLKVKGEGEAQSGTAARLVSVVELKFSREVFSIRENQIIDLLAQRYTSKEIGERLFVSENTIKAHLKNMYRKTGTNKRSHFLYRVLEG